MGELGNILVVLTRMSVRRKDTCNRKRLLTSMAMIVFQLNVFNTSTRDVFSCDLTRKFGLDLGKLRGAVEKLRLTVCVGTRDLNVI